MFESAPFYNSRITELKFICDIMLERLVTLLCSCGVDAVYVDTHGDESKCIRVAQEESRIVLTRQYTMQDKV